jgi:putative DNA primase/helicase
MSFYKILQYFYGQKSQNGNFKKYKFEQQKYVHEQTLNYAGIDKRRIMHYCTADEPLLQIIDFTKEKTAPEIHETITKEQLKEWHKNQNTQPEKKELLLTPQLIRLVITNYAENAKMFWEKNPYFYDKNQNFWLWNQNKCVYERLDDTDILRLFDKILGFQGQTITPSIKNNHLEAFKRYGREKMPKEAPTKWIQFKNKAFSIESRNIYDVEPNYFFTNRIPYEIGQEANTPIIDKLFNEWVGEKNKQTLYEIIAYCCYRSYPIQTLFCLYGSGRNGKTCFLKLLSKFLGVENVSSTDLDLLVGNNRSRFEMTKLYKKLCCMMGETNFGILKSSSLIKRITGGDLIGFEFKNKPPFDDFSSCKIIIASNSLPTSEDTSDGFYRRWIIIDFPNEFKEGKDVIESVPENEYHNLAKKVVDILPELLSRGFFIEQGNIEERKNKYIMASNPLPVFIERFCEKSDSYYVSYNEFYSNYIHFLKVLKRRRVNRREFKESLESEGFWVEKVSRKDSNGEWVGGWWIDGLRVRQEFYDNYDNYTYFSISLMREKIRSGNNMEKGTKVINPIVKSLENCAKGFLTFEELSKETGIKNEVLEQELFFLSQKGEIFELPVGTWHILK